MAQAQSGRTPTCTRRGTVSGHTVLVFDGLMPPDQAADTAVRLRLEKYALGESDRGDLEALTWSTAIPPHGVKQLPIYEPCQEILHHYFSKADCQYGGFQAMCNQVVYGDMLFIHPDIGPNQEGYVTAIWFLCAEWRKDWGGELLWFDDEGDVEFVVSPKLGRLVMFDGHALHAGRAPTRQCRASRLTLVLKFRPIPGSRDAANARKLEEVVNDAPS